tara:strand:+ start:14 stop:802 length:789 start_codon:yes stop_codon:yes gene_type:complete
MGAYTPESFTGAGYAAPTAQQTVDGQMGAYTPASGNVLQEYMTPYLQGALQPQYDAANRQSQIRQLAMQSQYGKAGAYGGGRQAVAGAELDRGLLDRMADITGTGYQSAFEQAQKQFNTEQDRARQAQDVTNRYGFDVLDAQQAGGEKQRAIEAQGIAADIAQFEQERDFDKSNVLFKQSLLDGMPLETQDYTVTQPSGIASLAGGLATGKSILDTLSGNSTTPAAIPANRMTEFNVFVSANTANGMNQAEAEAAARTTMGL